MKKNIATKPNETANKKVIILYASVGGGHFKAAEGIKNYISENYENTSVEMIDALKYTNKLIDKMIISSYINMARYSPKMWGEIYKFSEKQYSVANFSNAVQKILSQKLFKLLQSENPTTIISTHPFITEMVASLKKHNKISTELNVIITDYVSHKFWELKSEYVNRYFVANEEMKYDLIHNGISVNKIFVTGIPVGPAFLADYNKSEIYKEFELDENKKTVLLFGGGEYGLSSVKKFLEGILSIEEDIQMVAIAGKNTKTQKMFKEVTSKYNKKVVILGYTTKVPELMQIADFIISKPGGLTTTEILVSNVPFVVINPVPGQEEGNANFLLNSGAAVRIFDADKTKPFFEELINNEPRIKGMKEMQKLIAKPYSTKAICEVIMGKPKRKESLV